MWECQGNAKPYQKAAKNRGRPFWGSGDEHGLRGRPLTFNSPPLTLYSTALRVGAGKSEVGGAERKVRLIRLLYLFVAKQAPSDAFSPTRPLPRVYSLVVQFNMDQLDLPPLPASQPALNRKRTRLDYEPATSSDPAVFSSDEQAPSAESYSSKRRKDKWTGTWWGAKARDATTNRKRSFRRNFDSGIYMGSEGTDSS